MPYPLSIFFSYSHTDEKLLRSLQKHMHQLETAGLVHTWYDRAILPGTSWNDTIREELCKADIILFLVSADFLSSAYICETEIKMALEQHRSGQSVVVPILLRKCDFESSSFSDIQGLPTDMEPVSSRKWHTQDHAFYNIVSGLKRIIHREIEKKKIRHTDADAWAEAQRLDTPAGYAAYIKNAPVKNHLEEALQKTGVYDNSDYKLRYELQNLELELERRSRKWIYQELHDNIGQQLSVAKLWIGLMKKQYEDAPLINQMEEILMRVIYELRNIYRLPDSSIYDDDIDPAINTNLQENIENLVTVFSKAAGMQIETKLEGLGNLQGKPVAGDIRRIIQEALYNSVQHANASAVTLDVLYEKETVYIHIADNGKKEISHRTEGIGGWGLRNIEARVSEYGGSLVIKMNNTAMGGWQIDIVIPCQ